MAQTPTVVFVCEHGSAKSIIAAAHLNRLARERRLNLRAVARGTDPDATIPPHVLQGLLAEGLRPDQGKPGRLSPDDLRSAIRLIAFCDLPREYHGQVPVERWSDVPPVSQGYEPARDMIAQHVSALLDALSRSKEV